MIISFYSHAQCKALYIVFPDSVLLIQTKTNDDFGSGSLRDTYYDDDLGTIYIGIAPGLLVKVFDTRYMSFVVVVNFSGFTAKKPFNPSAIEIEFTDHTGFKLKTDTLLISSTSDTFHFYNKSLNSYAKKQVFYLSSVYYTYLIRKPLYRVSLLDDATNKEINIFPDRSEFMKPAACILGFLPKETEVEHYSRVMDSLLHTKMYGNMGK